MTVNTIKLKLKIKIVSLISIYEKKKKSFLRNIKIIPTFIIIPLIFTSSVSAKT